MTFRVLFISRVYFVFEKNEAQRGGNTEKSELAQSARTGHVFIIVNTRWHCDAVIRFQFCIVPCLGWGVGGEGGGECWRLSK